MSGEAITELDSLSESQEDIMESMDAQNDMNEATATLEEIDRSLDIVATLEHVALTCESIQKASYHEVTMLNYIAELALAGSGIGTEELLPSLETTFGREVNASKMKKFITAIWGVISKMVEKAWKLLMKFLERIMDGTNRIRSKALSVVSRIGSVANSAPREKTILLMFEAQYFINDSKVIKNAAEATVGLVDLHKNLQDVLHNYSSAVLATGKKLTTVLSNFNVNDPEASLKAINGVAMGMTTRPGALVSSIHGTAINGDGRYGSHEYYRSAPIVAGEALVYRYAYGGMTPTTTPLEEASLIRHTYVSLEQYNPHEPSYDELAVQTFGLDEIAGLCRDVVNVCDVITSFRKGAMRELESVKDKLVTVNTGLSRELINASTPSSKTIQHHKAALQYITTYTRWATNVQTGLISLSHRYMRAVLNASIKSLREYD